MAGARRIVFVALAVAGIAGGGLHAHVDDRHHEPSCGHAPRAPRHHHPLAAHSSEVQAAPSVPAAHGDCAVCLKANGRTSEPAPLVGPAPASLGGVTVRGARGPAGAPPLGYGLRGPPSSPTIRV